MVAATKSLFQVIGDNTDIPKFFKQCTATIKQMNMKNLFMALTLIRLKENKLTVSSAGMPPMLIYRKEEDIVEDIIIKGPPLGGFSNFDYKQKETYLKPGDMILIMSDGFAEQFNDSDDMIGYDQTKDVYKEAVTKRNKSKSYIN